MKVQVVVEGESDKVLLERILADLKPKFTLHVARGKNDARPWARRLQREKREPVLLVVDADTDDEREAREEQREYSSYLSWSSGGVPYHVTVLVPEAEVLLFKVPGLVERLADKRMPSELLQVAHSAPRKALAVLFGDDEAARRRLFGKLTEGDIAAMRLLPEVAEVRNFVSVNAS